MRIDKVVTLSKKTLLPTYSRASIEFVKGKNARLWDSTGKKYVDFLSGLGVNNLGHHHPKIKKAIKKATNKPWHVTNLFQISKQASLAEELLPNGFQGKTFFANSGTEANEALYKFAIKYGKNIKPDKIKILSASNSFHGRSFASLNLTGQPKLKEPFSPLLPNVDFFKFNNYEDFLAKISDEVAAVVLECVQGEGGIHIADKAFMRKVATKCKQCQSLLFIDEVQSGNFRTGRQYAFEHYDIIIDGFTTAKALANGLPTGTFTVRSNWADIFAPGDHGSTFGGNPLVTSVGLATLRELKKIFASGVLADKINLFSKHLSTLKEDKKNKKDKKIFTHIKEIRQLGMMIAIEFVPGGRSAKTIAKQCLAKGLIVGSVGENIIRLLPPLVIKTNYINRGMGILRQVIGR